MDWLHIVLRVVHIGAGIFWVGSSVFLFTFIEPTMKELGPQGGPFMRHLTQRRRLPVLISISGVLTIGAGIWLYWRDSGGFDPDWITTSFGLSLTVGALAAMVAFVMGISLVRPRAVRMGELGGAMASGPPSEEQVREMGALQRSLHSLSILNVVLLGIAVVAMSAARFL